MSEKRESDVDGPDYKDQCRPALSERTRDDAAPAAAPPATNPSAPPPPRSPGDDGGPGFKDQCRSAPSEQRQGGPDAPPQVATPVARRNWPFGPSYNDHHRNQEEEMSDNTRTAPIVAADAVLAISNNSLATTKKRLILFVDDEVTGVDDVMAYLKRNGYDVVHTTSTSGLLTLLLHGLEPDVIVSDMGRVEYVSLQVQDFHATAGLFLIEEVRRTGRTAPIFIFTTPDNVDRYREDVVRVGGSGIVAHPSDLVEEIAEALPMASARAEP